VLNSTNTPARAESWTLLLWYRLQNSEEINYILINYLSNGEIDKAQTSDTNLSLANEILEPAISLIRRTAQHPGIDIDFGSC
jgi:hypothetical protein